MGVLTAIQQVGDGGRLPVIVWGGTSWGLYMHSYLHAPLPSWTPALMHSCPYAPLPSRAPTLTRPCPHAPLPSPCACPPLPCALPRPYLQIAAERVNCALGSLTLDCRILSEDPSSLDLPSLTADNMATTLLHEDREDSDPISIWTACRCGYLVSGAVMQVVPGGRSCRSGRGGGHAGRAGGAVMQVGPGGRACVHCMPAALGLQSHAQAQALILHPVLHTTLPPAPTAPKPCILHPVLQAALSPKPPQHQNPASCTLHPAGCSKP